MVNGHRKFGQATNTVSNLTIDLDQGSRIKITTPPSISAVIPTLNEEEYLPELLRCLRTQNYPNLEVIVADYDSTDATRDLCRRFDIQFTRGGLPGEGRNAGTRIASGQYLLFLDADTSFPEDFVRSLLDRMEQRRADACSVQCFPLPHGKTMDFIHRASNLYFWLTTKLGFPHGIGACLMVRREAHDAIGGFDESVKVAEDQDYIRRLAKAGHYDFFFQPAIRVSTRRFVREGLWTMCLRWVFIEFYRLFIDEIRKEDLVKYFSL
jgi:glycosyltransferase involved in cell wall biosynthesis